MGTFVLFVYVVKVQGERSKFQLPVPKPGEDPITPSVILSVGYSAKRLRDFVFAEKCLNLYCLHAEKNTVVLAKEALLEIKCEKGDLRGFAQLITEIVNIRNENYAKSPKETTVEFSNFFGGLFGSKKIPKTNSNNTNVNSVVDQKTRKMFLKSISSLGITKMKEIYAIHQVRKKPGKKN